MRLASHVYVLDLGRVLAAGTPAEVQANQMVIDAYLGAGPVSEVAG
jgi:branched-chain amino acid transport system ATP-binding protein